MRCRVEGLEGQGLAVDGNKDSWSAGTGARALWVEMSAWG